MYITNGERLFGCWVIALRRGVRLAHSAGDAMPLRMFGRSWASRAQFVHFGKQLKSIAGCSAVLAKFKVLCGLSIWLIP